MKRSSPSPSMGGSGWGAAGRPPWLTFFEPSEADVLHRIPTPTLPSRGREA